jgi:hypothetical protein
VPTRIRNSSEFEKYVFHATAVASHFRFADGEDHFGHQYALVFRGATPFHHREQTGRHTHPEISFTHSWVHVSCQEARGVYTTIARSGLKNFSVKDKLTASKLEAGIMTVYRKEWYKDPARPKRALILPLPPVVEDLKVCGRPYRLGKELQLPEAFLFSNARRKKYFLGDEPEIEPARVSNSRGQTVSTKYGDMEISDDTRRIGIPNFGIVTLADWMWQPPEIHTSPRSAQWVQLVGLDLKNPGSGGGASVGGNGSPSGK